MSTAKTNYETLLAECSNALSAIALLKQYRAYLEMIPSLRRPKESVVTIPFPIVRVRNEITSPTTNSMKISSGEATCLPCDVALLMCDPEWKIQTGIDIFLFIHRPQEEFSELLMRWRKTQLYLDKGYEWIMPLRYKHIYGEESERSYPLFVLFPETPERIMKGLRGANLPFVVQSASSASNDLTPDTMSSILSSYSE